MIKAITAEIMREDDGPKRAYHEQRASLDYAHWIHDQRIASGAARLFPEPLELIPKEMKIIDKEIKKIIKGEIHPRFEIRHIESIIANSGYSRSQETTSITRERAGKIVPDVVYLRIFESHQDIPLHEYGRLFAYYNLIDVYLRKKMNNLGYFCIFEDELFPKTLTFSRTPIPQHINI